MKTKIKYISFPWKYDHKYLQDERFQIVENPTNFNNLPDGEYMIRGNKKGHRKEYWVIDNIWYLISDVKEDLGHFNVDSTTYMLFPILKHNEYLELKKHINKLSPLWQRNVYGYFFWLELKKQSRDIKKSFLDVLKDKV